jgi:nitrate reductase gamma subunit
MINELDDVILTCDLAEHGLSAGDIGTAVLVHRRAAGYEVEFTTLDGDTIAVVTLMANQVRATQSGEIAHVRALAAA